VSFVLTAADRIFIGPGDSLTAGFSGSVRMPLGYLPLIRQAYGTPSSSPVSAPFVPPVNKPWPRVTGVNAGAGRSTLLADTGGSMATLLAPYSPATAAIVQLGINDAANIQASLETIGQLNTQVPFIINAFGTLWGIPPSKILWIGPWGHDSGDLLTQVAQVDAAIAGFAASMGFTYCQLSNVWPATAASDGTTIGDGTHPTLVGVQQSIGPKVFKSISLQ